MCSCTPFRLIHRSLCRMFQLRQEKEAAEERAAQATTEKKECERAAARQVQAAHQQMIVKVQVGVYSTWSSCLCTCTCIPAEHGCLLSFGDLPVMGHRF